MTIIFYKVESWEIGDLKMLYLGVKPVIHQSELRTYTKVVPFQEKNSFHFVNYSIVKTTEWNGLIKIDN